MQVVNCSSTVLAISAQYTVLAAQASTPLTFNIFLTSSQANAGLSCEVTLVNTLVSMNLAFQEECLPTDKNPPTPCAPYQRESLGPFTLLYLLLLVSRESL